MNDSGDALVGGGGEPPNQAVTGQWTQQATRQWARKRPTGRMGQQTNYGSRRIALCVEKILETNQAECSPLAALDVGHLVLKCVELTQSGTRPAIVVNFIRLVKAAAGAA